MQLRATLLLWGFCVACAPQVVNAVDDAREADASFDAKQPDSSANGGAGEAADAAAEAGELDAGGAAPEPTLRGDALIHRYSFSGEGTQAFDSKGAAHGSLIGATLTGAGSVTLDGAAATAQYVDFPDQLISGLGDATLEVWLTWQGGEVWQRIFDFGDDKTQLEDARSVGRSYLFLSPHGGGDYLRAVYKNPDIDEVILDIAPALPVGKASHLAVVFDDTHDEMRVFVDGVLGGAVTLDGKLSQIHDINDWLGRSQFASDAAFSGSIDEFRIYDAALSAAEIEKSAEAGPDAEFQQP